MVDLRYLQAFHSAARALSFSKAARELRISPSALSRQIALLEKGLGGEVFVRTTRSVHLTALGRRLLASADRVESELRAVTEAPPVRIGCLQSVFEFVFTRIMERHPKVFACALDYTIGSPRVLREKLLAGEVDLVLTHLPPDSSAVTAFRLYEETLSWVGRRRDRAIVLSAFEDAYPEHALHARDRIRINSFNAAVALADRGLGRALVALPSSRRGEHAGKKQWIWVATPAHRSVPAHVAPVLALLRREARGRHS